MALRRFELDDADDPSRAIAPDCRGWNFYETDEALRHLLALYLPQDLRTHLEPHYRELGQLAGGRLDELATIADRHGPVLHPRDRFGRDEEWIEYHPAYREMEEIAFSRFGMHAAGHRGGVLGWPEPLPPLAKYALQYLFAQAEFGLLCPISLTDTSTFLIGRYGDAALKAKLMPGLLAERRGEMLTSSQFMTERTGGSDVGLLRVEARREGGAWRIHGDKWFCSHADADLIVLLARPEGAPAGTRGLGVFVVPRHLEDGSRNAYRIVRLKDKLGTRSMASGEIRFEGAFAWPLGDLSNGLKQMLDQVNLSRLSHGVRAAGMMRRCLNEALVAARHRVAFGGPVVEKPLMRRQLLKIMLPTEQALSAFAFAADAMGRARAGDGDAETVLRLATPLAKFRACRDNMAVATGAMEVRGGNGYIEDWVNARLVRDSVLGTIWEGTSNMIALDVVTRAVAKARAHEAMAAELKDKLAGAHGLPGQYRGEVEGALDRALRFAEEVTARPEREPLCRKAAGALYHAMTASLMAWEAAASGDGRRLVLSRLVLDHRLAPADPMGLEDGGFDGAAADLLLRDGPVSLGEAAAALAA